MIKSMLLFNTFMSCLKSCIIQTLRAFRRAAKVDVSEELKFERPVHEGGPGGQVGGPKPDPEANLDAKSLPRRPAWRPKAGPGGQVGDQNPTLEANLDAQS